VPPLVPSRCLAPFAFDLLLIVQYYSIVSQQGEAKTTLNHITLLRPTVTDDKQMCATKIPFMGLSVCIGFVDHNVKMGYDQPE
jgi:hypothetical protein